MRVKWNRRLDGSALRPEDVLETHQEFVGSYSSGNTDDIAVKSATLSSFPAPASSSSSGATSGFLSIFGLRKKSSSSRRSEADSQSTCSVASNLTEVSNGGYFHRRVSLPTRFKKRQQISDEIDDRTNGIPPFENGKKCEDSKSECGFKIPDNDFAPPKASRNKSTSFLRRSEKSTRSLFSSLRGKKSNSFVLHPEEQQCVVADITRLNPVVDKSKDNSNDVIADSNRDVGNVNRVFQEASAVKLTSTNITKSASLSECQPTDPDSCSRQYSPNLSHSIKSLGPVTTGVPTVKTNLFTSARSFFSRSKSKTAFSDTLAPNLLKRSASVSDGQTLKHKIGKSSSSSGFVLSASANSSNSHIPTALDAIRNDEIQSKSCRPPKKKNGFFSALKLGTKHEGSLIPQPESSNKVPKAERKRLKSKIPRPNGPAGGSHPNIPSLDADRSCPKTEEQHDGTSRYVLHSVPPVYNRAAITSDCNVPRHIAQLSPRGESFDCVEEKALASASGNAMAIVLAYSNTSSQVPACAELKGVNNSDKNVINSSCISRSDIAVPANDEIGESIKPGQHCAEEWKSAESNVKSAVVPSSRDEPVVNSAGNCSSQRNENRSDSEGEQQPSAVRSDRPCPQNKTLVGLSSYYLSSDQPFVPVFINVHDNESSVTHKEDKQSKELVNSIPNDVTNSVSSPFPEHQDDCLESNLVHTESSQISSDCSGERNSVAGMVIQSAADGRSATPKCFPNCNGEGLRGTEISENFSSTPNPQELEMLDLRNLVNAKTLTETPSPVMVQSLIVEFGDQLSFVTDSSLRYPEPPHTVICAPSCNVADDVRQHSTHDSRIVNEELFDKREIGDVHLHTSDSGNCSDDITTMPCVSDVESLLPAKEQFDDSASLVSKSDTHRSYQVNVPSFLTGSQRRIMQNLVDTCSTPLLMWKELDLGVHQPDVTLQRTRSVGSLEGGRSGSKVILHDDGEVELCRTEAPSQFRSQSACWRTLHDLCGRKTPKSGIALSDVPAISLPNDMAKTTFPEPGVPSSAAPSSVNCTQGGNTCRLSDTAEAEKVTTTHSGDAAKPSSNCTSTIDPYLIITRPDDYEELNSMPGANQRKSDHPADKCFQGSRDGVSHADSSEKLPAHINNTQFHTTVESRRSTSSILPKKLERCGVTEVGASKGPIDASEDSDFDKHSSSGIPPSLAANGEVLCVFPGVEGNESTELLQVPVHPHLDSESEGDPGEKLLDSVCDDDSTVPNGLEYSKRFESFAVNYCNDGRDPHLSPASMCIKANVESEIGISSSQSGFAETTIKESAVNNEIPNQGIPSGKFRFEVPLPTGTLHCTAEASCSVRRGECKCVVPCYRLGVYNSCSNLDCSVDTVSQSPHVAYLHVKCASLNNIPRSGSSENVSCSKRYASCCLLSSRHRFPSSMHRTEEETSTNNRVNASTSVPASVSIAAHELLSESCAEEEDLSRVSGVPSSIADALTESESVRSDVLSVSSSIDERQIPDGAGVHDGRGISRSSCPPGGVVGQVRCPVGGTKAQFTRAGGTRLTGASNNLQGPRGKSRIPKKQSGTSRPLVAPRPARPPMWLSKAELTQEIQHLSTLCESRTKELNMLRMESRKVTTGFDALAVVIHYMTSDLKAFKNPQLTADLNELQKKLDGAKEELARYKNEIDKLNLDHAKELNLLSKKLEKEHQDHIESLMAEHEEKMRKLREKQDMELRSLTEALKDSYEEEKLQHAKVVDDLKKELIKQREEMEIFHQHELDDLEERHLEKQKSLMKELEKMQKQCEEAKQVSQNMEDALQKDSDSKMQWITSKRQDLQNEVDSLKAVLEIKNNELHSLRKENLEMQKELEELHVAKEKIKMLQARAEDLQALMNEKVRIERQLSNEHQMMKETYEREAKVNKRLSMENEELLWRLKQVSETSLMTIPISDESDSNVADSNLEVSTPCPLEPSEEEITPSSPAKSPRPSSSSVSRPVFFTYMNEEELSALSPQSPRTQYKRIQPASKSQSPARQFKSPSRPSPRRSRASTDLSPQFRGDTPRKLAKRSNSLRDTCGHHQKSDEKAQNGNGGAAALVVPDSLVSSASSENSVFEPCLLEEHSEHMCTSLEMLEKQRTADFILDVSSLACNSQGEWQIVTASAVDARNEDIDQDYIDPKTYYHMTFPVKEPVQDTDVDEVRKEVKNVKIESLNDVCEDHLPVDE